MRVNVRRSGMIEIALQDDVEIPSLCARAVIGKVQALFDDGIDFDGAVFFAPSRFASALVLKDAYAPCRSARPGKVKNCFRLSIKFYRLG